MGKAPFLEHPAIHSYQLRQEGKGAEFFLTDHHRRRTAFDHRARTSHGMHVSGGRRVGKESPQDDGNYLGP